MKNTKILLILAGFFFLQLSHAYAQSHAKEHRALFGYSFIAEKTIQGSFEGCSVGKEIMFMDGTSVKCATLYNTIAYMPTAYLYAKNFKYNERELISIRMLVDGIVYDMAPLER
jgi:hypothetical protein